MTDNKDHSAEILFLLAKLDKAIRDGIVAELLLLRPSYELAVQETLPALKAAYEALEGRKEYLRELDELISAFEGKAREHESMLDDGDLENRIVAQVYVNGFRDHIAKLEGRRREVSVELGILTDEHASARAAKERAETELREFEVGLEFPYLGGQQTRIYQAYRVGSWGLWTGTLQGICTYEQQAMTDAMDSMASVTGYRTDDLAERMRQAAIAEGLQQFRNNFPGAEESSAPSGQDIREGIHRSMENQFASQTPSVVEDRRHTVAIPVPQRDFMTLPARGKG